MNEYMPLIMAAGFVTVLSVAIRLFTGKNLRQKDSKQTKLDFSRTHANVEQSQREIAPGARR